MKTIDKLAWIFLQDGRILVTRSRGKDTYYIPGGKREIGESDHSALIREIKEELTVDLDPASLKFAGIFTAQAHGHASGTTVTMTCYFGEYTGTLNPAAEIEELRWLTNADRELVSEVDKKIFTFLAEQRLLA